jgi:hypothetical protein
MNPTFLTCLLLSLLSWSQLKAQQPFHTSATQLTFAPTTENGIDSLSILLSNLANDTNFLYLTTFDLYGHKAFWTRDSIVILPPNTPPRPLFIYFKPRHNILNQSELLMTDSTGRAVFLIELIGQGVYSKTYWDTTKNLEGEALRSALNWRTGVPYTQLGYSGTNNARLRMFGEIDNWKLNGREPGHANPYKNECVYTGRTISYTAASFNTGTLNNAPFQMNTEHTWPQSFGASSEPMQSDLHHLYISDGPTNSARGNKPFGWVPNPTLNYTGGSKANTTTFEPRDEHKTGVAAAMLYFSVRYKNQTNVTHSYMTASMENDLREWLQLFPPDSLLQKRNDDIQSFQQNRNPFIDYPQLLDRMTQVRSTAAIPNFDSVFLSQESVNWGTLPSGSTRPHAIAVVNNGNRTIQLSNIQATGNGLVYNGPTNIQLVRGEGVMLNLTYTATSASLQGSLQFNTTAVNRPQVTIPIVANTSGATISPFSLLAPFSGLTYNIQGDSNQQINFRWRRSVANPSAPIQYSLRIYPVNNPSQIIFERNGLTDSLLSVNYGRIDAALTAYGLTHNDLLACRWLVEADAGSISTISSNENNINFLKGVVTAVPEIEDTYRIYPNPAHEHLFIKSPLIGSNSRIEVRDALGRLQQCEFQIETGIARLNVAKLAAGLYFAYLVKDGRQQQLSFIVSR